MPPSRLPAPWCTHRTQVRRYWGLSRTVTVPACTAMALRWAVKCSPGPHRHPRSTGRRIGARAHCHLRSGPNGASFISKRPASQWRHRRHLCRTYRGQEIDGHNYFAPQARTDPQSWSGDRLVAVAPAGDGRCRRRAHVTVGASRARARYVPTLRRDSRLELHDRSDRTTNAQCAPRPRATARPVGHRARTRTGTIALTSGTRVPRGHWQPAQRGERDSVKHSRRRLLRRASRHAYALTRARVSKGSSTRTSPYQQRRPRQYVGVGHDRHVTPRP